MTPEEYADKIMAWVFEQSEKPVGTPIGQLRGRIAEAIRNAQTEAYEEAAKIAESAPYTVDSPRWPEDDPEWIAAQIRKRKALRCDHAEWTGTPYGRVCPKCGLVGTLTKEFASLP